MMQPFHLLYPNEGGKLINWIQFTVFLQLSCSIFTNRLYKPSKYFSFKSIQDRSDVSLLRHQVLRHLLYYNWFHQGHINSTLTELRLTSFISRSPPCYYSSPHFFLLMNVLVNYCSEIVKTQDWFKTVITKCTLLDLLK